MEVPSMSTCIINGSPQRVVFAYLLTLARCRVCGTRVSEVLGQSWLNAASTTSFYGSIAVCMCHMKDGLIYSIDRSAGGYKPMLPRPRGSVGSMKDTSGLTAGRRNKSTLQQVSQPRS